MTRNINLLDFNTFFIEHIQKNILDSLLIYKLLDKNVINLRNSDTKRLITYFIAYHISKVISMENSGLYKPVCVIQPEILNETLEICTYCNIEQLKNIILPILKGLKKSNPNNVIILKKKMDINSPDTIAYIFSKSNSYRNSSLIELKKYNNSKNAFLKSL